LYTLAYIFFFFFFQAEDGIRDRTVTGVQTCALPISPRYRPNTTSSSPPNRSGRLRGWRSYSSTPSACTARSVSMGDATLAASEEIGRASCRERVEIEEGDGTLKEKME